MSEIGPSEARSRPRASRRALVRRVVGILLVIYVVLFVVLNRHGVRFDFVFFSVHTTPVLALAIVALLSFGAGYLVHGRRSRRR